MRVHQFPSNGLAAGINVRSALSYWCLRVGQLSVSEHAGWAGWRIGWHKLTVLRESDQCLVPGMVAAEGSDNALVQVIQETFCTICMTRFGATVGGGGCASMN